MWSVKTLLRLSLKKEAACRGKDTVGTGWRRTIGHLFLGNFRRRLARVYVIYIVFLGGTPRFIKLTFFYIYTSKYINIYIYRELYVYFHAYVYICIYIYIYSDLLL